MLPGIVDVTRITGAQAAGSPTSWQTPNGPFNVEHVGVTSPANELLAFWWSPQHDWQVVNVTAKTGQQVIGGLTSWQTHNGPFLVEHLAGRSPAGDLLVSYWSPQHDWQAVNVSAKTGRKIAGAPVSWVTPDGVGGTVEHLAARGADNELLVFFWTHAHDWQVVDVTAKTGRAVVGDVTAGSDPATGYDLLPDAPPPHASLRWADGTPSGFAVRNISPAGAVMSANLTVPW